MSKNPNWLYISWSSIQSFLSCQRRYELSYIENLQRKPGVENRNLLLGSAVHAGIEAALRYSFEADQDQHIMTEEWLVGAAINAAQTYLFDHTAEDKQIKDYTTGQMVTDMAYYDMLLELKALVVELLAFHIPLIGIGTRYMVPRVIDFMNGLPPWGYTVDTSEANQRPTIEVPIELPLDESGILTGYADSILWDADNNEYVLIDWKTRGVFPDDRLAALDGQLHLYAAALNETANFVAGVKPIQKVILWQVRTKTPSPASISKRTNLPNVGAESYDTTQDYWLKTLPKGIDPEKWLPQMAGKFKDPSEFQRQVTGVVTDTSSALALENAKAALEAIRAGIESRKAMPAVLGSRACEYCDFLMLCQTPLRYGGDIQPLVEEFYQPRRERTEAE